MDIYRQIAHNNRQTVLILLLFALAVGLITFLATVIAGAPPEDFPVISSVVFGLLLLWILLSYFYGDKLILNFVGAKEVERKEYFDLYNAVENVAIIAGLPTPRIFLIEDVSLNAFATGRNPRNSVVCVTTGLYNKLERRELEGVIAHELGHIANYDIRLELLLITVIGALAMLGEVMMRVRGQKNNSIALAGLFVYLIGAPLLHLIRLALSRNREYLADATGAFYTRDPAGLAGALDKISTDSRIESADKMKSTAGLFIADPQDQELKKAFTGSSIAKIFSTHPPIAERIKRLRGTESSS